MEIQQKTIEDALVFIEEKNFLEAKNILTDLIKEDDKNSELWKNIGLCNVNLEIYKQAFLDFQRTVELNDEDATAWYYLGNMASKLQNYEIAEKAYKKVFSLRPDYSDAYKGLLMLYMQTNQKEKIAKYEKIFCIFASSDYKIYYMLGTFYMSIKKYLKAIELFEKALEKEPEHAMMLNNLGSSYIAMARLDKALEAFEKSFAIDDTNPVTHFNIAVAARMKGDFQMAYKYYQSGYKLEPIPFYLTSLALAALEAGDYTEAVSYHELLCSAEPERDIYKINLASAYEGLKDYEKALEILQKIKAESYSSYHAKMKMIDIYIKLKDYDSAKDIYKDLLKKGEIDESLYYDYAILCGYTGEKDKAELLLKKVIQLNPYFAPAHKDLAVLYLDSRLFDYAKDEFEEALKIDNTNPYILYEYGNYYQMTGDAEKADKIYDEVIDAIDMPANVLLNIALNKLQLQKPDEAQSVLERAIKIDSQDIDILFNLGKIYFMKGNFEAAKQIFEDAMFLEKHPEIENMLAQIYVKEDNYKDAIGLFADIDKKYPKNTFNLMNLAKCAIQLDKKEDAINYLQRYTDIFPEDTEAIAMLSNLL